MKAWVRQWIAQHGGDPDEMQRSYLAVGMSDEDYERGVLSLFPPKSYTSTASN